MIYGAPRAVRSPILLPVVAAALVCATIGVAMSARPQAVPLLAIATAMVLLASRWRAGVIALVAVLPFAGVPALLIGEPGLLVLDALIVLPLYVAFAFWVTRERTPILPEWGIALPALGGFAALVVAYAAISPTPLAGAIGVRVWLAYVPLLAVGYCFVRRAADFDAVMRLTALIGLVPAAVALVEWAYASHGGDFGPLERLYATSSLSDVGRFVIFTTGTTQAKIPRVPSLFTGVSQYEGFALVAYAAALSRLLTSGRGLWLVCAGVLAIAAIASGARATYVLVPTITGVSMLLRGPRWWHAGALAFGILAGGAALMVIGVDVPGVARALPDHVAVTLRTASSEFSTSVGVVGHGTGWDTNAALRYANIGDRRYIENWYAKAALETGALGLIAIVVALGAMFASFGRGLRRASPKTRAMAAPIVALLLVVAVALFKGPYIDLQPLSLYFWLFAGMAAAVLRRSPVDEVRVGPEVAA